MNGCTKEIFSTTLQAYPKPSFDISGVRIENDKCSLNTGSISGIKINGLSGNNTTYIWKDENNAAISTIPSLQQVGSGSYYLVVTDGGTCTVQSNPFTVGNDDNAAISPIYENLIIPRFMPATITVKNLQTGSYYLYSDPVGTQLLQQNNSGIFITNSLADNKEFYIRFITGTCSSTLIPVKVNVVDKSFFAIPSAFTPNNDGKNDKLNLKVIGYIDVEYFKIFNRNGEEVFSTKTVSDGWNGVYRGQLQTSSVFVWIAKGKDLLGNTVTDKGTFVLVR
jgi:gliding motility-associated-like protein